MQHLPRVSKTRFSIMGGNKSFRRSKVRLSYQLHIVSDGDLLREAAGEVFELGPGRLADDLALRRL